VSVRAMKLLRPIAVEAFAGVDVEFPLLVLLEKPGQASLFLIPRRVDIVDGLHPNDVEDLKWT
jgi:hypothetical protein